MPTSAKDNSAALVIVESPAKAKTIAKYLGPGFVVGSSIGHIRDLPSTAAEIPARYKAEPWARIGVNVERDFEPLYIVPAKKKAQVTKLKTMLKKASVLYLATDEDREGEAIAWHLVQVLNPKVPVKRMVFDEITRSAIREAVENSRDIDLKLVEAQEARRILDRLYGYEVSPVLWRKVAPRLSAGRVQSVATRMIVDRERERIAFVSADYWDIDATLRDRSDPDQRLSCRFVELDGKRVAGGKDFNPETGKLIDGSDVIRIGKSLANGVADRLRSADFTVIEVTQKPFTQRTPAPFITSTLQQESGRKLRFSARRTMRLAQSLYENGYITYMRTDSTHLSTQAINAARAQITELYGAQFMPDKPRVYANKSKSAQEAHEAIRPAGESFRTPQQLKKELDPAALKLYGLIWKRTVACQMKDATGLRTTVRIAASAGEHGRAVFTASGKVITFAGFLRAYVEGSDDPEAELSDQERILPPLKQNQILAAEKLEPKMHTTQPPPRFTEASLIREMEEGGIGRPSTYASIIQTIEDRGYVWKKGSALVPSLPAFAVINLLEKHFADLVNYDFTAKMEDDLDAIANGRQASTPWLKEFYFGGKNAERTNGKTIGQAGLKELIGSGWEKIDARQICSLFIGTDDENQPIVARVGRYGPYIQVGDSELRANLPADIPLDELKTDVARELLSQAAQGDKKLGHDPESGKPVYLKHGRFGPYVQLGDPERTEKGTLKKGGKPKMASLWPNMEMETLTLDDALLLLSFPKVLGVHPEKGQEITVQDGRYGPYVKMGDETRPLESHEQLRTIDLDEAVRILNQPKRGRPSAQRRVLADLGQHPQTQAPLQVLSGRFGPYVTDGVVNASLPRGRSPETLTVEQALELIAAREDRMRQQGKDPRAPKAKKKATKRSTQKKKTRKKTARKKAAKKKSSKKTV